MEYKISRYESETIVSYNEEEKTATLYTCSGRMIKKMDSLCEKHPDTYKLIKQDDYSKTYVFPKKLHSIRTPRIMSEEQKEMIGERLKASRQR